MSAFTRTLLSALALLLFSFQASAQRVQFHELLTCFNAPEYPQCLFDMIESKGFERIDKEYYENCDRVIYAYPKSGRPTMFFNPMLCHKPYMNELYPVKSKSELELQFQKSSRPYFESLCAQIRKECTPLKVNNGQAKGKKGKETLKVYLNKETGVTILVKSPAPVAYIYLLK